MRTLGVCLGLLVSGCTTLQPPLTSYHPFAVDVVDQLAYNSDLVDCVLQVQGNYKPTFDWSGVGSSTVSGAAYNAAGAAVSPAVPAIGAAGEGGAAAWRRLDVTGAKERYVVKKCMEARGLRSGKYTIADPD